MTQVKRPIGSFKLILFKLLPLTPLSSKNLSIFGPYSTDTAFSNYNLKKFDVIFGIYHDQVLTPFKALFNLDAVNITLGLPFIRISPDH